MADPRTDHIAREAARLLELGHAATVTEAIRLAGDRLGYSDAPRPGEGHVRRHAQGMAMQALGSAGYEAAVREIFERAEELMTLFSEITADVEPILVGRAAEGLVDGPVTLHVRLYTERRIEDLAALLVEHDYAEPEFETINTRFGRLNRLRVADDQVEFVLTRCLPTLRGSAGEDLFAVKPVPSLDLAGLRTRLGRP